MATQLISAGIIAIVNSVASQLGTAFGDERRGKFTQETVQRLFNQYPDYNVIIVHTAHHF